MFFLYSILSFFLFFFIYKKEKGNLLVPTSLIVLTWGIFPAINSLRPSGIYALSSTTHVVILLSLFSFIITYYLLDNGTKKNIHFDRLNEGIEIRYFLLISINSIIAVWLFSRLLASWETILIYGWANLRQNSQDAFGSGLDNHIHEIIAKPFIIASMAIVVVDIMFNRGNNKNNKWKILLLIIVFFNLLEETIIFAARAMIIRLMIMFMLTLFLGIKLKAKKIGKMLVFLLLMVFIISIITKGRNEGGGEESFGETFIIYYIAPFNVLDYLINHPEYSHLGFDNLTFGSCIFGSIYNFLYTVFSVLTGADYQGTDYIINQVAHESVPVSNYVMMNAATTANYCFLKDFGMLGVVIGFSLMALFVFEIRRYYFVKPNIRYGAYYVCALYIIFRLSVWYDLLGSSGLFSFAYIWLMTRKRTKKNKNYHFKSLR